MKKWIILFAVAAVLAAMAVTLSAKKEEETKTRAKGVEYVFCEEVMEKI